MVTSSDNLPPRGRACRNSHQTLCDLPRRDLGDVRDDLGVSRKVGGSYTMSILSGRTKIHSCFAICLCQWPVYVYTVEVAKESYLRKLLKRNKQNIEKNSLFRKRNDNLQEPGSAPGKSTVQQNFRQ
eukprot:s857_g12.t1